jgi:hypothetical protein
VVPGSEGVVEAANVQDRHTVSVRIFLSETPYTSVPPGAFATEEGWSVIDE